jgi:mannosyltransferase OCH1-like enzyme
MIPKIIHLCWLSGDAFPSTIEKCLNTWRHHLADYDIWLWGKTPKDTSCLKGLNITEKHFDINSVSWTRQAYEAKKYAFAADYIRLYALYNYGGIYLDADVIIYKSFNDLLNIPYFIGCDQIRAFEAAVIGTEKSNTWIKDILDAYADKSFIKQDGSYDITELPVRFHHELVNLGYTFRLITCKKDFKRGQEKHIEVFDKHFFNSRNAVEVRRTKKSYCAHNYTGSWQKEGYGHSFKDRLPNWLLAIIYTIGQKTWARNKYAWFQIPFENN